MTFHIENNFNKEKLSHGGMLDIQMLHIELSSLQCP
jgi:hypothetical protein